MTTKIGLFSLSALGALLMVALGLSTGAGPLLAAEPTPATPREAQAPGAALAATAAEAAPTGTPEASPVEAPAAALVEPPRNALATPEPTAASEDLPTEIGAEGDDGRVVVPDLRRERVDRAIRRMRALGLRLRVVDDYRDPVEGRAARRHRIRSGSQVPAAGTVVEPGQLVRAKAYSVELFAEGY